MPPLKLLLIQPPIQDFYETAIRLQPIGLCYLKAAVQKFLPEVRVCVKDYHHGWGRCSIALPQELAYLKEYYAFPDKSPFSTFYHYYHFGATFDDLAADVAAEQPDLVGISSLFSPYYREVLRCADAIKQRRDVPIIVGGSHVSACPELMLAHESVDFVIRGEGERPLVEFLRARQTHRDYAQVPNLGFKESGTCRFTALEANYALDELPPPDFSDFPAQRYRFEGRPLSFIITSRGCPHRCSFCSVHLTFGHRYRKRSTAAVLQEIRRRYADGCRVFDFEDDNLTFDRDAITELCEKIIENFPQQDIQLLAMNGISYESLDPELLALMKQAGFSHLNLSLVSADQRVRRQTRRPHSLERYFAIVGEAASLGYQIVVYQILGLPQETLQSMIATLLLNAAQPVLLGASMFYLPPGSPIAQQFATPTPGDIFKSRLTSMAIETTESSREDIFTLFITTRILNFLKGLSFQQENISLESALYIAEQQGGRTALGAAILRKLLAHNTLSAAVGKDFKPVQRFHSALFQRVWKGLEYIRTQEGKKIWLSGNPRNDDVKGLEV